MLENPQEQGQDEIENALKMNSLKEHQLTAKILPELISDFTERHFTVVNRNVFFAAFSL